MKFPLTIVFITARREPRLDWFMASLRRQLKAGDRVEVIAVSLYDIPPEDGVRIVGVKPNIWQGPHRIMKRDWWGISTARNTGLCLCTTPWILFTDDRGILYPHSLRAVNRAMHFTYAVNGSYEKVHDLVVENGLAKSFKETGGKDCRIKQRKDIGLADKGPMKCPGQWWFGAISALPTEWALAINGWDETCDGLGMEDNMFGVMLENSGFPVFFDPELGLMEDRTPYANEGLPVRRDKGIDPNDKSHMLLNMLKGRKTAAHHWNIRQVREDVLAGKPWPIPTEPVRDFFDGQLLSEMEPHD